MNPAQARNTEDKDAEECVDKRHRCHRQRRGVCMRIIGIMCAMYQLVQRVATTNTPLHTCASSLLCNLDGGRERELSTRRKKKEQLLWKVRGHRMRHTYLFYAEMTKYPRGDGPISDELKKIYDEESKVHVRLGVCACLCACMHVCVHVCMHACLCACVYAGRGVSTRWRGC